MDKKPSDPNDPIEQMGGTELTRLLGIGQEAGAKRYFRAVKRLKDVLATLPGGSEVF